MAQGMEELQELLPLIKIVAVTLCKAQKNRGDFKQIEIRETY